MLKFSKCLCHCLEIRLYIQELYLKASTDTLQTMTFVWHSARSRIHPSTVCHADSKHNCIFKPTTFLLWDNSANHCTTLTSHESNCSLASKAIVIVLKQRYVYTLEFISFKHNHRKAPCPYYYYSYYLYLIIFHFVISSRPSNVSIAVLLVVAAHLCVCLSFSLPPSSYIPLSLSLFLSLSLS